MKIELTTETSGFKNLFGGSVLFKLGLIGFLTLLLLIPSAWVQELITERQNRQEEVIQEISDKWAGSQLIQGPVMVLPYKTIVSTEASSESKSGSREVVTNIYILPELLDISSTVDAEVLHRGSFDAIVYNTRIKIKGKFSALELKKSGIDPAQIQWDKANVVIGLSDLKGLKNAPVIQLGSKKYAVEPDFTGLKLFRNNLIILPDLSDTKDSALDFNLDLDIRGSNQLRFLHLGKNTTVRIQGKWENPSFTGRYLPETRTLSESAFSATWNMPHFNRPFPQQWIAENTVLNPADTTSGISDAPDAPASFGVALLLPVDQYQKTTRSAKYAPLIILMTFISLLFTELLSKQKVHLLQYVLIGGAMTIYYTLLLSLSEQVGFNIAYLIASVATVGLIGMFIQSLLRNKTTAWVFAGTLGIFYGLIYVIIQLQDVALLVGSLALFILIAALMYFSQKLNWEKNS